MREGHMSTTITINICERIQISCTQMTTMLGYVPTSAHPPIQVRRTPGRLLFSGSICWRGASDIRNETPHRKRNREVQGTNVQMANTTEDWRMTPVHPEAYKR